MIYFIRNERTGDIKHGLNEEVLHDRPLGHG